MFLNLSILIFPTLKQSLLLSKHVVIKHEVEESGMGPILQLRQLKLCEGSALSSITREGAAEQGLRPESDSLVLPHCPDTFSVFPPPNLAATIPSLSAETKVPLAHLLGLCGRGLEFVLDQPVAKQQQK